MTLLRPIHLLFLGLRIVSVFLWLSFFGSCFGLIAIMTHGTHPSGLGFELLRPLVSGVLAFWLFFFPDITATAIQRWAGTDLSAHAICMAGIALSLPAVVSLTTDMRAWLLFRSYEPSPTNPLFIGGVLPNNPIVAANCLLFFGGLTLLSAARPLTVLSDRELRQEWIHRRKVASAIKELNDLD